MYGFGVNTGGYAFLKEFDAPSEQAAWDMVTAWLTVEGYDPKRVEITSVGDRDARDKAMADELMGMSARFSLSYGVAVEGPFLTRDAWEGGKSYASVRMYLPSRRGVVVTSSLTDGSMHSRTEAAAIREDAGDRDGWVFDTPEGMQISVRVSAREGQDDGIREILDAVKGL